MINVPYNDIPLAKTDILDGRLRVSWDPPKTKNRIEYTVTRGSFITKTYNTWLIDSAFLGGSAVYVISADLNHSTYQTYAQANYEMPALIINNSDLFTISWNKFKFYNAFKAYRITVGNDINATVFEKGVNDTSFIFRDGIYGQKTQVRLELLLKPANDQTTRTILLGTDERYFPNYPFGMFASVASVQYPLSGDNCYVWNYYYSVQYLAKFSVTTREYTMVSVNRQSFDSHFSVSPGSNYIMYDAGNELRILNANNFETVNTFSTTRILPLGVYTGSGISDVGTIVYWDDNLKKLVVYDLLNEADVSSIPLDDGHIYSGTLSGNGKYLFEPWHSGLYKIENSSFTEISSDQSQVQRYVFSQFSPGSTYQLALYDGSQFTVKKCSDFSTERTFPLSNVNVINVDFPDNKILTWKNSNFYIYSLIDGHLLNTIPTEVTNNAFLFNNHLCSPFSQLDLNKLK